MAEAKVRSQYDRLATVYDIRWRNYIKNTLFFLKNWAQISQLATVLDVACGTGELEKILLTEQPTQNIVGVDISEKMLLVAKEKCQGYPNVSFHLASASALPFPSNSFDVIVSANAFHYFDNPLAALAEMKRVLKYQGSVIILDWCRDYFFCQVLDMGLKIFDPAHQQCYNQKEFHQILAQAEFEVLRASRVRFGLFWGLMICTAKPHITTTLTQSHK